jgi:hypothetical protein
MGWDNANGLADNLRDGKGAESIYLSELWRDAAAVDGEVSGLQYVG